jgi:Spy/CpxP family protein refolding chaperone
MFRVPSLHSLALMLGLALAIHLPATTAQASRWTHQKSGEHPHELIAKHAERLGIPEEVVAQVTTVAERARTEMKALMMSLKEERVALKELLRGDNVDRGAVMAQIDVIGEVEVALRKHKIGVLIEIRELLTREQLAEVKALMSAKSGVRNDLMEGQESDEDVPAE